jgi:Protein of unknown function (DUF1194)
MKRPWLAGALAIVGAGVPHGLSAEAAEADVALVLAIDVSGSVNDDRFTLQRNGIAAALESDDFAAVLSGGAHQTIEIAVVEWAEEQNVVLSWTILHGREDLASLARRLRGAGRSWVHTKTDPGGGIAAANLLFSSQPLPADRQVIDVSGDGRQNTGEIATAEARDAAVARDVTVNGLPITLGEEPDIDEWYRANVIGGPGAFLVVADGYEAFAAAFRQKLTLEVAGLAPSRSIALAAR